MQNISPLFFLLKDQKSKISESESSINSRTCLGHLVLFILDFCDVRGNQPTMRPKGQFLKFGLIVTHEAGVHPSNLMNVGDKKWFLFLDSCC